MAEAAGLAVGILALAGTFKDCIDLFSYFSAAKSMGRDYEILSTKLDIEKTLLLQWAQRIRLLQPTYDRRLDASETQTAIARVLACIAVLLSDSNDLQNRYGVKKVEDTQSDSLVPAMSKGRMASFINEFKALKLHIQYSRNDVPRLVKVKWAIQDGQKFRCLVDELSDFVSKLNQLVPDQHQTAHEMCHDDLNQVNDTISLVLIQEACYPEKSDLARLAHQRQVEYCEKRILDIIWFRFMDERRDNVQEPHEQTLSWALDPPEEDSEWYSLAEWLSLGKGIYWVSGKPGSGKSTLMKYIFYHRRTNKLIEDWASNLPFTLASFFFWWRGHQDEQKNQEGLARALLYNILSAERLLIPLLLPNLWREAFNTNRHDLALPSPTEMTSAFEILGKTPISRHFCLFIDGLDEYEGDYRIGIDTLKRLAMNPNIKIVVSSRPITVCMEAFSNMPKLFMQDLNRTDIVSYAQETIGNHTRMQELLADHPKQAAMLLKDLETKSSGVFLWVILACRSLQDGFAAHDRISDLQRRVVELPPELEQLFQHILEKIEPRYRFEAVRMLRLTYHARLGVGVRLLGLAILEDVDWNIHRIRMDEKMSVTERKRKCSASAHRLRSRCVGLLEPSLLASSMPSNCFCMFHKQHHPFRRHDTLVDSEVVFLHRTVYEFLDTPGIWNLPVLKVRDDAHDDHLLLFSISLRLASLSHGNNKRLSSAFFYFASITHVSKIKTRGSVQCAITKFEEFIVEVMMLQDGRFLLDLELEVLPPWIMEVQTARDMGLILAVELGLPRFVQCYETLRSISPISRRTVLLKHAICRPICNHFMDKQHVDIRRNGDVICYLLSAGCDPNEAEDDGLSSWQLWTRDFSCIDLVTARLGYKVLRAFIEGGARLEDAEGHLRESLRARIKGIYGVGLSRDATAEYYNQRFGPNANYPVPKRERPAVMGVGLKILEYLDEVSGRGEIKFDGTAGERKKKTVQPMMTATSNRARRGKDLDAPRIQTSRNFRDVTTAGTSI